MHLSVSRVSEQLSLIYVPFPCALFEFQALKRQIKFLINAYIFIHFHRQIHMSSFNPVDHVKIWSFSTCRSLLFRKERDSPSIY